jgi:replicative superfamily II helicase
LQTDFGELGSSLVFALRQDADVLNDVGLIVFDEGHMIGVGSREIRSEVLVQRLLRRGDAAGRQIVGLSAMFTPGDPYFKDFGDWLRSDAPGEPANVQWRPRRSIGALEAIPECLVSCWRKAF